MSSTVLRYDIVIAGGGPAGLTAGLYAARAGLSAIILERALPGGQMMNASLLENYPGFPEGVSGADLAEFMQQQASKYGVTFETAEVIGLEPGQPHRVITDNGSVEARAVIVATGSQYTRLNAPGEDRLLGRGVSYCATCDGFLFRGRDVVVVGGGDTAITDALELTHHAARVNVVHRRDQLRASDVLQRRAFEEPAIAFVWDSVVDEVLGEDRVTSVRVRNVKSGQQTTLDVGGVFVAVGIKPNSQPFSGSLQLDGTGQIVATERMATPVEGVFVAGDVRSNSPRQVSTAVGDGATAAVYAARYLQERG